MTPDGGAGVRAWALIAAVLGGGSVLAWWLPAAALDWQPALALAQPWRAVTAAWVHWSPLHLIVNLVGCALVGALGWAARVPRRIAAAWTGAWPLTQFGLLLRPELAHYGGLSGVLHAGVAVAATWLVLACRGPRRTLGGAVLAGLAIKLLLEAPWGAALRSGSGWDIAVAPLAHATGAIAGTVCAVLAWALAPPSGRRAIG